MFTNVYKNCDNINDNGTETPALRSNPISNNLSSPVVDSLKIRIPTENVIIKSNLLKDNLMLVNSTNGEILDENFKQTAYMFEMNGIKTYYKLESQVTASQTVEQYLTILLTSKVLESDYLKGISNDTIITVYDNLMSQNIVSFSYDNFLKGEITDTDIKMDGVCSLPVINIIDLLYANAKPTKTTIGSCQPYRQKTNLGIQYSLRKTKAFKRSPYLKFYEKVRELQHKSVDFYKSYIEGKVKLPKELLRIETTIKNKKHFKILGLDDNTLIGLLSNLTQISHLAFQRAFEAHIMINVTFAAQIDKLRNVNINDRFLLECIMNRVQNEIPFSQAIEDICNCHTSTKHQKYKLKKRIKLLTDKVGLFDSGNDSLFDDFMECLEFS